jgi:iron complex outermembrane recepter protein
MHGVSPRSPLLRKPARGLNSGYITGTCLTLGSLKLTARMPATELSALASYFRQTGSAAIAYPRDPAPLHAALDQRAYSGELRLTSPDPVASLSWIAGVFSSSVHSRYPMDFDNGSVIEQSQLGGFGQIALKLTRRLTASAGLRIGYSYGSMTDETLPLPRAEVSDTWNAPRVGLSWQVDDHNLVYLTIAKGYGSPGFYPSTPGYPPESLWSYEIGSKHDLLEGRLRLETGLFHINWDNGPLDLNYFDTEHKPLPGRAVSNGFDITAQALVTDRTKLALSIAYTDAHLTQSLALDGHLLVRNGAYLPVSPWNVTASVERDFRMNGSVVANVRVEDTFRSIRSSYWNNPAWYNYPPAPPDPSTNILNVRAALKWSDFEAAAFLSNALGSQPIMTGASNGVDNGATDSAFTFVPRTLSVSGTWRF